MKTVAIWLIIAFVGIVLYILPEIMKRLYLTAEAFQADVKERADSWKFIQPTGQAMVPVVADNTYVPKRMQDVPTVGPDAGIFESTPSLIEETNAGESTPMLMQGKEAQRTVKAPANMNVVEGFDAPPPGPSPSPAVAAPPPGPSVAAPPPTVASSPLECPLYYNPNINQPPIRSCDGPPVFPPTESRPFPKMLGGTTTRDGLDDDEVAIMNYWLANSDSVQPTWVSELFEKDSLSSSEKTLLANWAKQNTLPSQVVIKSTKNTSTTSSSGTSDTSGTSAGTSTGTGTSTKKTTKCKPKCTSKKACPPPKKPELETCKGPIQMGDYIRKDSIPCWACNL